MAWLRFILKRRTLKTPYTDQYNRATIIPTKKAELQAAAQKIKKGQSRYQDVADTIGNGMPWWFIGILHYMEAGMYNNPFAFHLHCGDPLTGRTVNVPKGRPKHNPDHGTLPPSITNPYSWEESALDAIKLMGYTTVKDWSIENCLHLFEKYNGMGYKKKGVPNPYLWSYTDQYLSGKYVKDGKYDPNAVSRQPGVAAIMKTIGIH